MASMLQLPWLGALCVAACLLLHWFGMNTVKDRLPELWVSLLVLAPSAAWIIARGGWFKKNKCSYPLLVALTALVLLLTATRIVVRLDDRLDPSLEGKSLIVVGTVAQLPQRLDQSTRFLFAPESMLLDGVTIKKIPSLIRLNWSGLYANSRTNSALADPDETERIGPPVRSESLLRAGQRWRFDVRIKRPVGQVNAGQFDSELKALQNGIAATGTVRSGQMLKPFVFSIGYVFERLRDQCDRAIGDVAAHIDPRTVGLIRALTVGNQQAIHQDDWQLFNRTGVSHLMSISGLHITMLAALAAICAGSIWTAMARLWPGRFLAQIPNKRSFTRGFALVIALLYCLIAGWEVPSQRTWYCLALLGILVGSGRRVSFAAVLQMVALVILLFDPWAVMSTGFWLSFGAVAAIVWANLNQLQHNEMQHSEVQHNKPSKFEVRWAWLARASRSQWACTISLIPLLVFLFGNVAIIGPLANAIAIPVVSFVITPLALIAVTVSLWFETPGFWIMQVIHWVAVPLLTSLEFVSRWQFANWSSASPPLWLTGIGLLGTACLLAPFTRRARIPALLAILACLVTHYQAPDRGAWRMSIVDVGQGAATVIESDGQIAIIDTGASEGLENGVQSDAAKRVLVPWLQTRAIDRIDYLILSSAKADRIGGAASLIRHIKPRVIHAGLANDSVLAATLPVYEPCLRGHRWQMGQLSFEYLHPPADPQTETKIKSRIKANSCVLRIDGPHHRIIVASDIEAAQEQRLMQLFSPDQLKADIVFIPNQGGKQSSSEAFVQTIAARYAVISSGYRNRFKLPNDQILSRYESVGTEILRTDRDGGLTINFSHDGRIQIDKARAHNPPYWRLPVTP